MNAPDRISARGGEILTVSYEDAFARPDGSAAAATAQASAVVGADGLLQLEPSDRFIAGDTLRVIAVDGDEHGLMEIIETAAVNEAADEDSSNEENETPEPE